MDGGGRKSVGAGLTSLLAVVRFEKHLGDISLGVDFNIGNRAASKVVVVCFTAGRLGT